MNRDATPDARDVGMGGHPHFDDAVEAIDRGDLAALRELLGMYPELVGARTDLEPPFHYFSGATLLHHVAGNPDRGRLDGRRPPLSQATVDAARMLLDAGADVHARTIGPNGGTTMGLVLTSKQASDADVSGALIDLLIEYGDSLDASKPGVLSGSLTNHAPAAAYKLIEMGAQPGILGAAALGRMDWLRDCFDADGHVRDRPRPRGEQLSERDTIGMALLIAYVNEQVDTAAFLLEKDGNWNVTGVGNGTAMHNAAWNGDIAMIEKLVARGADISNRDNPFVATPFSWAQHNRQDAVVAWFRANCSIDLHDAVCFGLEDHVEARIRENPSAVHDRIDQWDVPGCTPLHWAAWTHIEDVEGSHELDVSLRVRISQRLLDAGADVNAVAGNGMTPLDIAVASDAAQVSELLERHGGLRGGELAAQ